MIFRRDGIHLKLLRPICYPLKYRVLKLFHEKKKKCHVLWEKFQLNKFTTDILIFVVSTPSSSDQLIFPCLLLHYRPAFTPCWRSFLQAVAL